MPAFEFNGLTVESYTWDVIDSNSYLICGGKHGLLIDAVDSQELYRRIAALEDLTILLTHSHFDHISGLNSIREILPGSVVISTKRCSEKLGNQYKNMSSAANAYLSFYQDGKNRSTVIEPFICAPSDRVFEEETQFEWHGRKITLKPCFGHSDDGVMILMDGKWLFSGDTILPMPTVTRFIGGSKKRFREEDIPYLETLTEVIDTVFPGHGSPGKLEDMIAKNRN